MMFINEATHRALGSLVYLSLFSFSIPGLNYLSPCAQPPSLPCNNAPSASSKAYCLWLTFLSLYLFPRSCWAFQLSMISKIFRSAVVSRLLIEHGHFDCFASHHHHQSIVHILHIPCVPPTTFSLIYF